MTDRIVYQVISQPGGVDGLDHGDKGGLLVNASFDKQTMYGKYGKDCRFRIEATVIDMEKAKAHAMAKLDVIDRLALLHYRPEKVTR